MRTVFDSYNAKTVTPSDIEKLQEEYGYNDSEELGEFITAIYLEKNPNFNYKLNVINLYQDFKEYYEEQFIYTFDECDCISWFIKDNTFYAISYDNGDFYIDKYILSLEDPEDSSVLEDMRYAFGQWEVQV